MNDFHRTETSFGEDESISYDSISVLESHEDSDSLEDDLDSAESAWDRLVSFHFSPDIHLIGATVLHRFALHEGMDTSPVLSSLRAIEFVELWPSHPTAYIRPVTWHPSAHIKSFAPVLDRLRHAIVGATEKDPSNKENNNSALVREFLPSSKLIEFWANGMRAYMALRDSTDSADRAESFLRESDFTDVAALQRAFFIKLKRMFSQIGYRQQNGLEQREIVADDKKFTLRLQLVLLDRFPLIPYDTGAFLSQLYSELSNFLAIGGRIKGNWGELRLNSSGILIDVLPEPGKSEEGYESATMIE